MRALCLLIILFNWAPSRADVLSIDSPSSVRCKFKIEGKDTQTKSNWVSIKAQADKQNPNAETLLAIGKRQDEQTVKIYRIVNQSLIRVGDRCELMDISSDVEGLDGSSEILIEESKNVSARYRPLVYLAPFGETASTLSEGENIIDVFTYYSRGLTNNLSASSLIGALGTLPNVSMKWRFLHNEWMDVAMSGTLVKVSAFNDQPKDVSGGLSIHWDIKSNTKWVTHSSLTLFTSSLQPNVWIANRVAPIFQSSIHAVSEYILNSWNRLLIGPQYKIETQSVGGFFGYMFVWDHFHVSINLNVNNITNLKLFKDDGYVPYLHAYWRF